ncbi:MAG TPA: FtsX-like permease family protein, partial [Planctomycetota bacterium]|nr:FtsX-like permease family protein [Planctomycetota bacterium]
LTNWGIVAGSKEVNATVGTELVGHTFVHVPPRSTVSFTLPIEVEGRGEFVVHVNPSLPLTIRSPPARFEELPRSFVLGSAKEVRVVDERGTPVAGVSVRLGEARNVTDADGRAALTPTRLGPAQLVAWQGPAIITSHDSFVVRPGEAQLAIVRPLKLEMQRALVSTDDALLVNVTLTNVGGAEGLVRANVTLDGAPRGEAVALLAPGAKARVEVALSGLEPGVRTVDVEGLRAPQRVEVFPGDARVEAALRAREAARADPGLAPRVGASATEYVDRIVRNVALAAAAITIAAGALCVLALATAWSRHLAERAQDIGVLKALGADREKVLGIVSQSTVVWSSGATLAGIAAGLAIARALDATGIVRAFGHRVAPSWSGWGLLVLFGVCVLANVLLSRQIAGRLYDSSTDALLARHIFVPPPVRPPTLHEALEADTP